ncbi:DNA modification system-associated small protein [Neisseria weixii]|uniref:DNA modification system-associated small protein n=1 Tax=Neisseria weixii TaxID=1853276 RepID=UPI0035A1B67D
MNRETEEKVADLLLWSDGAAKKLMSEIAKEHSVSIDALAELVAWERDQQERIRRRGMTEMFNEIFENKNYWK